MTIVAQKSFHPLYRGTWFPTAAEGARECTPVVKFPSAVSRYLVSNLRSPRFQQTARQCFHPLYRGTWFPT